MDIRYNNAKDLMTTEEMAAFVNRALANPNNWMVHSTALLLRSRIEKEKFRTAGMLEVVVMMIMMMMMKTMKIETVNGEDDTL